MNISIKLLHGVGIVKNKGDIPITEDPLVVSFTCDFTNVKNIFVTVASDKRTVVLEASDGVVVIPKALKVAGVLNLTFKKIINGEVLHVWSIEPILLKDVGGKYTPIPQIIALEQKISALTEAVAELKKIIIEKEEF